MCLQDKKTLRESTPDNSVAHLQEELIAVKLREAEANLSLKDLRQRVGELSQQWQRHLQVTMQGVKTVLREHVNFLSPLYSSKVSFCVCNLFTFVLSYE
jgi:hypothetical protein